MTTSPRLRVYRRGVDAPDELLGEAQLLWPGVAQVLPPLDAELARTPHRAQDLVVVPHPAEPSGETAGSGDTGSEDTSGEDEGSKDRANEDTAANEDAGPIEVLRIRPSLIGYDEAERLSAHNGAAGMLARTANWMVALELGGPTTPGPDDHGHPPWPPVQHDPTCGWGDSHPGPCRVAGDPWWCNIFCVRSSCSHC